MDWVNWDDETIALLRRLWRDGHSTAEIARKIGTTKNSIVGKAHRLGLDRRPSPIRRDGPRVEMRGRPVNAPKVTLPPLGADDPVLPTEPKKRASPHYASRGALELADKIIAAKPVMQAPAAPQVEAPKHRKTSECCWPIGEPGTKMFRFCDDPSPRGRPYCDFHADLAFVKIKERRRYEAV